MLAFFGKYKLDKVLSVCMLAFILAGCSHEGVKRFIMLPAAVERENREKEEKANSLVIPPKWHKAPSQKELAKSAKKITDAPLYTADKKPNPEAVEPDYKKEREEETEDHRTPR